MENENSFLKSDNFQKVKIGQISDLEKERSAKKLNRDINELKIHKMPNIFKSGQFNSSVHPNDIGAGNEDKVKKIKKEFSDKHKKIGVLIIVFGVVVLIVLGFFVYKYIFNNPVSLINKEMDINSEQEEESLNNQIEKDTKKEEKGEEVGGEVEENEIIDDSLIEEEISEPDQDGEEDNKETDSPVVEEENIISVLDSDNDGLSDLEEIILGTDPLNKDSDGDSYSDLEEVLNLYNPMGSGLLDLSKTSLKVYKNDLYKYSLIYPGPWEINEFDDKSSVMFMNQSNEGFFQIAIESNIENISVKDWYIKQFNIEELPENQYFEDEKREFVFSEDGMYVYLTDSKKQRIFTISYSSLGVQPAYPNLFSIFINSFEFLED